MSATYCTVLIPKATSKNTGLKKKTFGMTCRTTWWWWCDTITYYLVSFLYLSFNLLPSLPRISPRLSAIHHTINSFSGCLTRAIRHFIICIMQCALYSWPAIIAGLIKIACMLIHSRYPVRYVLRWRCIISPHLRNTNHTRDKVPRNRPWLLSHTPS